MKNFQKLLEKKFQVEKIIFEMFFVKFREDFYPKYEILAKFYRIVQECLNNVIKHSQAANVWLSVKLKDDLIEFICRDDARGFDFETAKNSSKSGLGFTELPSV